MKADIHSTYYPKAAVRCGCGNKFTIGSTKEKIDVEICSACHPFFTGTEKVLDTAGRVEKFKTRRAAAALSLRDEGPGKPKTKTKKKKE